MSMRDYVTPTERLNFNYEPLVDFTGLECTGCGVISDDLAKSDGWTDKDFDNNSRTTVEGNWYCHIDCFRDSR